MALSRGSRRFLIAIAIGLGVLVAVVGAGLFWVNQQLDGTPGPGDPVEIEVASGASASSIASQLADNDVIRNALAFRLVARSRGLDSSIASGIYDLETGMSVDEAIEVLQAGPRAPDVFRTTIAEGLTVAQTLARLADQSPYEVADYRRVLDEARADPENGPLRLPEWLPPLSEFSADLEVFEGLLFPETFEFRTEATPVDVLQRYLDQTEVALASVPPSAIQAAEDAGITRYEALVAASLVERETRVGGEWAEVAAVIRNRLDEGMLLQIDATLLYAAGNPEGGPSSIDTQLDSPYNTYQNPGLPPTPISGARAQAIRAVFEPADVDFFYYVLSTECDGSHVFARTLDEHNANVADFRAAGRCS